MSDLVGIFFSLLGRFFWGLWHLLTFWDATEEQLSENSRLGESPMERQLREKRRRWIRWMFICACLVAVCGGVIVYVLKH